MPELPPVTKCYHALLKCHNCSPFSIALLFHPNPIQSHSNCIPLHSNWFQLPSNCSSVTFPIGFKLSNWFQLHRNHLPIAFQPPSYLFPTVLTALNEITICPNNCNTNCHKKLSKVTQKVTKSQMLPHIASSPQTDQKLPNVAMICQLLQFYFNRFLFAFPLLLNCLCNCVRIASSLFPTAFRYISN